MTTETFRRLLANLLLHAAEGGVDPFEIHYELLQAGEQLLGDCRCELAEADEAEAC
jgi:hypothetical protein